MPEGKVLSIDPERQTLEIIEAKALGMVFVIERVKGKAGNASQGFPAAPHRRVLAGPCTTSAG